MALNTSQHDVSVEVNVTNPLDSKINEKQVLIEIQSQGKSSNS